MRRDIVVDLTPMMTVFVVTIVKVFAVDLAELDRIYRVLIVIGLGVTLLVTSYLYQRSRP